MRSRVKWQKVGNKCTAEFFKSVRQKNSQAVISELKDNNGRVFTKREDLAKICLDFYSDLYKLKGVSEPAIQEILEDFPVTFTDAMNETLEQEITVEELASVIRSMAKGKAPGHDGIPIEFFQLL